MGFWRSHAESVIGVSIFKVPRQLPGSSPADPRQILKSGQNCVTVVKNRLPGSWNTNRSPLPRPWEPLQINLFGEQTNKQTTVSFHSCFSCWVWRGLEPFQGLICRLFQAFVVLRTSPRTGLWVLFQVHLRNLIVAVACTYTCIYIYIWYIC